MVQVLPRSQCEGIKKYIVGLIIKTSSNPELMEKEKTYLAKLNIILGRSSFQLYSVIFDQFCGATPLFASPAPGLPTLASPAPAPAAAAATKNTKVSIN